MKINESFKLRIIKDQYFIVDSHQSKENIVNVFKMNEAAAWLWSILSGKEFTADILAEQLSNRYNVEKERALKDVEKMLEDWLKWQLAKE
jgi:hypothetical protein